MKTKVIEGIPTNQQSERTEALSPELSADNMILMDLIRERDRLLTFDSNKLYPILLRPCRVKVLLVADGGLDFSLGGFGLRAFVESLLAMPGYHDITLAHIRSPSGGVDPDPRIANRIAAFTFDNAAHFGPDLYDQVWLFGIDTNYFGRPQVALGDPTNRLRDVELAALTRFMDAGGGLFATGDHGSLGVALGGSVPRARSMRQWGPAGDPVGSEVSMSHSRRNDTNRTGSSAGTQFNDQSDDVPQPIEPKIYQRRGGIFRFSFPHPLLCSPTGVIRVMPDHPHEGECISPANPNQSITFVNPQVPEYPPAVDGGGRPLPEVISTNSVPAGNRAGTKDPTVAQTFGGICAYDGHLAGIGRVVTDATWHHFVNINLTGDGGAPIGDPKRVGYLASPAGVAHLEQIKTYYRNVAVWLARPSQIVCMQRRLNWGLLWTDRVMEAVLTRANVSLAKLDARLLLDIGRHARDVLGQYVGQCQGRRLILYIVAPLFPKPWLDLIDPWRPVPPQGPAQEPDPVPVGRSGVDPRHRLGGALVALREKFPNPDSCQHDEIEKEMDEIAARGARVAVGFALKSLDTTLSRYNDLYGALRSVATDAY